MKLFFNVFFFLVLLLFSNAVAGNTPSADLTKKAEQGNAQAQLELGRTYSETASTVEDYKKAFHWYEKAAGQGVAKAQLALGILYCSGQGVEQNYINAYAWYGLAFNRGMEEAVQRQEMIADFFLTSREVTQAEQMVKQLEKMIKDHQ